MIIPHYTTLLILAGIGAGLVLVVLLIVAVQLCRGVVEFLDKV